MKIGIDARMISATGIGRYTKSLIEQLSFLDKKNTYYLFLKKNDFDTYKLPGKNFKKVLADFHWYGFSEQVKFPKLLKKYNLDLVHLPHFNIPMFYKGKFAITVHDLTLHKYKTARKQKGLSFVYGIRNFIYKRIIKKAIKNSEIIFTPSLYTKKDILRNFDIKKEKIIVTHLGGPSQSLKNIDPDEKIIKQKKIKKPYVLYVGNAYPHKNLEVILKALKRTKNIHAVFAGKEDHFYKNLKEEAQKQKVSERAVFTGFVTDQELASLYRNASLYVFPSFNEGFGLPPLEAMNFGLPVLSSDKACMPEILGDAALYFNPKKEKELARKITKIIKDEKLKEQLIEKGFTQVKKFSWERMGRLTLAAYLKIGEKNE